MAWLCLSSEMYGLTCVCVCGAHSHQLTVSSLHLLQCLRLNLADRYHQFFAALFSKRCINNTDKHWSEHYQQAVPHTVVTVVVD